MQEAIDLFALVMLCGKQYATRTGRDISSTRQQSMLFAKQVGLYTSEYISSNSFLNGIRTKSTFSYFVVPLVPLISSIRLYS